MYSPISQPCNCRREQYLLGNHPAFLCFLCSASPAAQHSTAQHSTAQHSTVNPHKRQSQYAPIRARQRKQADRVGSSQLVEHSYSSLLSQNEQRNRNLCGLQKSPTVAFTKKNGVMLPVHFLTVLAILSMHASRLCSRDGKIRCYGDAFEYDFLACFCALLPTFRFSFSFSFLFFSCIPVC